MRRYGPGDREVPCRRSGSYDAAERDPAGETRFERCGGGREVRGEEDGDSRSAGHTAETGARGLVRRCDRPADPLESQTSTRIDGDVTHPLVPIATPPRRSDVPTIRRAYGPSGSSVRGLPGGCIADAVLHFDLSRRHPRSGRIAASARRDGRSGGSAEREPACSLEVAPNTGETRCGGTAGRSAWRPAFVATEK